MRHILTLRLALCLLLSGLFASSSFANTATLVYDPAGNVATRTTTLGTTTYTYDQLNRLTAESGPAGSFTYHYDPNGVRLSDTKNTYTYSATSNRLISRNGVTVVTDAAGNITNDGLGHTYVYNQAGHLAQVLHGATLIATYVYDYRGFRTRKVTTAAAPQGAQVVRYVYDEAGHLVAEVGATGAAIRSYIWADDKLYAQIDHTPTWKEIYFEVDHLGTPRAALDQSGNVVWTWESDAFGAIQPNQNPTGAGVEIVNLRFPGQYYDQETGLYYNMQRYYDPTIGQYTQPDPIGLYGGGFAGGSWSTYTYVGGNPISFVDPSGLFVTGTYNVATGTLSLTDTTSGATISGGFFSGGKPYGLPIPNGQYDILEQAAKDGFFRLEPVDTPYGDDKQNSTGRDLLRLHRLGILGASTGCITANDNNTWKTFDTFILGTLPTDNVEVQSKSRNPFAPSTESLTRYGRITVINSPN